MRAIDHTGKKYGRLTALHFTGKSSSHGRIWRFRCDCGNEIEIGASLAKTGHTKSCGCLLSEVPQKQTMDRAGTRNGRLTFIRFIERDKNGNAVWFAECDCGGTIATSTPYKTRSCGCLQREHARRSKCLKGKRQGRLVFTQRVGHNKHGKIIWEALCDCGRTTQTVKVATVKSCGCLRGEERAKQIRLAAMPPEEKIKAKRAAYRKYRESKKGDPVRQMRMRITHLHVRALKRIGGIKKSPTLEALGYSVDELVAHIERQFLRGMGWHNSSEWHIDHIVPMSTARTVEDVIALNQLSNLRPLWAEDNIRKKDKRIYLI